MASNSQSVYQPIRQIINQPINPSINEEVTYGIAAELEEELFGSPDDMVELENRIQIQNTGHGMIAPPGEARGAMDSAPCDGENPYPGSGRLNTLTHD